MTEEVKEETTVEEPEAPETTEEVVEEEAVSDIDVIAAGIDKLQAENAALKAEVEQLKKGNPKVDALIARFNGTPNGSAPTREARQESAPQQDQRSFLERMAEEINPDDLH